MRSADAVTSRLGDLESVDPKRTGGKGANLATLTRAGLPVPVGFVVATAAYREFVREHRLNDLIDRTMAQLDDDLDVDAASAQLRGAFESTEMSEALRNAIAADYTALGDGAVAVRSSATAEDLPDASFAGQQETVLNVVGAADLCAAVRRCWSSLWTARAIAYRRHRMIGHEQLAVAVVVQQMVPAQAAGVMFTADPVSGRRDHIVIEAAAGLGEAVVSGHVTPDRWTVDARTRALSSGPGRTGERAVLAPDQIDALVTLGMQAAHVFGVPQDIEWAVSQGRCWLVQSRPITSLFPLPPASPQSGLRVYIPAMLVAQGIGEPFTPAGNAFFRALTAGWIRYLATGSIPEQTDPPPWLPIVAGRIFVDVTPLLRNRRLTAKMIGNMRLKDPAVSAALDEWLTRNSGRLPRTRSWTGMRGLVTWMPWILVKLIEAIGNPTRFRRRLLATADEELTALEREADALSSPLAWVEFVDRTLVARTCLMVVKQLPAAYGEQLVRIVAEQLIKRWLGAVSEFEPLRRWLPHDPTLAMGAELARLACDYAAAGTDPSPADRGIAEFLATYGHRAPDREVDLGLPRFADNPGYVVDLIRGYLRSGDPMRTLTRFESGAAQARATADGLVARVHRQKGPLRAALLRGLLNRHRELGGLRERPKFDMVRAIALGRRTLRRTGVALVAEGLLDEADDVFFVDTSDLYAALAGELRDLRRIVAANQREFERELVRRATPRILVSDGETVYGPKSQAVSPQADLLIGTPVSPGVFEGVARVLDSPVGANLIQGEVLVAASTDPGWTPLFLLAGALVMEVGGTISHGAVVAREYGIPAVAAVPEATTRLHTGQRIRVDGGNGTVTLLEPGDELAPAGKAVGCE